MSSPLFTISVLAVFAAVACIVLGAVALARGVPRDDRKFLDPLPPQLERLWPAVNFIRFYLVSALPESFHRSAEATVSRSGLKHLLRGDDLLAIQALGALFFGFLAWWAASVLQQASVLPLLGGLMLGGVLPRIKLADYHKRRQARIMRHLPIYLDYLHLSVGAGLNLSGAIKQATDYGPDGPLKNEFMVVLRDIRAGASRRDAMKRMGERVNIRMLTQLVRAIDQADRQGTSMAKVLRIQSEQITKSRFQRAEKQAMETPVKLMGPLVLFIFPTTFIVLLYPIILKVLQAT